MESIVASRTGDGVLRLTLNRPHARNAFDLDLMGRIRDRFEEAAGDGSLRVVVLGGAGSHFCAGGDIDWMRRVLGAPPEEKRAHAMAVARMLEAVHALPQPLVAQVQGAAMGGGFGLVCCADFVVADARAQFALSETRLGIVPAAISPYVVAAIGVRQATQLALAGTAIDAAAAQALGLVTHVAPAGELASRTDSLLRKLLAAASGAQRKTKALLRGISGQSPNQERLRMSVEALLEAWGSDEAAEGFDAFLNKTEPSWRIAPVPPAPSAER